MSVERDRLALADRDGVRHLGQILAGFFLDRVLDRANDLLALVLAAVDEEPSRALGHVTAYQEDTHREYGAEPESEPPADALVDD